jgi:3-oxoacyl-[acyl-carrier-protein] synthase-3
MMRGINLSNNEISVGIKGMGYYVPERILTNEELEKTIDTTDEWIREKIGIKERHICTPEQAASDLGIEAANRALKNAGVKAEDIDLIIMTTLQPDHIDPLPCSLIQYRLGAINAAAFNMSIGGCPDSLFSFITAANYIISGTYKNVLLINSEVNSKLINWKDRTMCVFFGDGEGLGYYSLRRKEKDCLVLCWEMMDPNMTSYLQKAEGPGCLIQKRYWRRAYITPYGW